MLTYLLVVVLGASAVGAEYRAGTVTTILTWEPRRSRLLLARLGATAIVGMLLFVVVHAVFIGGWALGASARGYTTGADADFWRTLVFVVLRGTLLAGALAAISGALATLGRNTAAAMGVWFGYLVVVEAIVRGQMKDTVPWMLTSVGGAFYRWDRVIYDGRGVSAGSGTLRLALYIVLIGGRGARGVPPPGRDLSRARGPRFDTRGRDGPESRPSPAVRPLLGAPRPLGDR